ncbi:lactate utilization protein [Magnetovibrio sp. PR-2]|uniref:LutC/YkgG family protein n=1 Tax=Magnetovibrio sp. PR-2 TaxID=3120356 RepID=UPI002FCE0C46
MSSDAARKAIFGRLKETLDRVHNPTVRLSGADQRMHEAPLNIIPKRGRAEGKARTELFVSEAETASAEVYRVSTLDKVVGVVQQLVAAMGGVSVKVAPGAQLKALDWSGLDVAYGRAVGDDQISVSWALGAVAETGTLVLASSPESPTTLNFLPDVHVVVLCEEDIAPNYEEVWSRLRIEAKTRTTDTPVLPRTVNWITGPSRTADIEQTLLLGAHGPRKLVIVLIDEQNPQVTTA